jgi:hypothetical protein
MLAGLPACGCQGLRLGGLPAFPACRASGIGRPLRSRSRGRLCWGVILRTCPVTFPFHLSENRNQQAPLARCMAPLSSQDYSLGLCPVGTGGGRWQLVTAGGGDLATSRAALGRGAAICHLAMLANIRAKLGLSARGGQIAVPGGGPLRRGGLRPRFRAWRERARRCASM